MSHLDEKDRKAISNMLSHHATCKEIADAVGKDPTAVSKEIKRNRVISKEARTRGSKILCKKLDRFPFVCLDCPQKYTTCVLTQMRYDASAAQQKYEHKLRASRVGINLTKEEHEELNRLLEEGLRDKRPLYSIVKDSGIDVSVPTVYRYIQERKVSVTKMDLPYAVSYKKRKRQNKKYEYPENGKIDRNNRTFLDYLAYRKGHPSELGSQMDFLGSAKGDPKSILVIIIPEIHFPLLFLVEDRDAAKAVSAFDGLEARLGSAKFREIFPSVLTDRDPCFSDIAGIEMSKADGAQRTFLFFRDAFKSNQKASVENINKTLRRFFPKGTRLDDVTEERVREVNRVIAETKLFSLDGHSPKEAFARLFGSEAYRALLGE